jgi:hypothetical protein
MEFVEGETGNMGPGGGIWGILHTAMGVSRIVKYEQIYI